ncbi:transporter substrate-binding domain-containing protein [Maridesulfovibrio sp.]|uniref:substrate-binding periplasmic protein n=1 Tax=Maridesulfovibrio sp. TaxID=2795000 RepID=UPI0029F4D5C2|nr:transporter substrate-binding domain-containing protein [Maridesulfovibrio sp.]
MRIALFVVLFLLIQYHPVIAGRIVAATIDYCPYQCVPEKEEGKVGYVTEILKVIYERAGYEITFQLTPYKRGVQGVERGEYDLIPNVNSGHSKKMIFSKRRNGVLRQNFYVRKGETWKYDGVESLQGITVGSVIGYDYSSFSPEYEAYLQKYKNTPSVQYVGGAYGPMINLKKILKGRITTFNEDKYLFEYLAGKSGIKNEFELAGTLGENMQYVGFAPGNSRSVRLAEIFDEGILQLRESGELKRILTKYDLKDWECE